MFTVSSSLGHAYRRPTVIRQGGGRGSLEDRDREGPTALVSN